jgi:hypothetical protein
MIYQTMIAAVGAALILAVEHYGPWEKILKRPLKLYERYVLGILALLVPFSVLLIVWQMYSVLLALWAIVAVGGVTTMGMMALDAWIEISQRVKMAEREASLLRPEVDEDVNE